MHLLSRTPIPSRLLRLLGAILMLSAIAIPLYLLRAAALEQAATRQPDPFGDRSVRPVMLILPPGTFIMGSPLSEEERDIAEVQHWVTLTVAFAISITEVTQGQFQRVMGANPSQQESSLKFQMMLFTAPCSVFGVGEDLPVSCVTWFEAVHYANRLSDLEGLERCYEIKGEDVRWPKGLQCRGYRLPTEAEWEYAARAGTKDRYPGTETLEDVCQFGNVEDSSLFRSSFRFGQPECDDGYVHLAPVAHFQPNAWGLYDVTGNVWEWTWDCYGDLGEAASSDPLGEDAGSRRVIRGGSWNDAPRYARVANRDGVEPSGRYADRGFRVARSYP